MRWKFLAIVLSIFTFYPSAQANPMEPIKFLVVQDAGRLKPYDTFARESLQLIYGRAKMEGKEASEIIFTWILAPELWEEKDFVQLKRKDLKEALKLDLKKDRFSPKELIENDRINLVMQDLRNKVDAKEKLDPYFQAVQRLDHQLGLFRGIVAGHLLRLVPPQEGSSWKSLNELDAEGLEKFSRLSRAFMGVVADGGKGAGEMSEAVKDFKSYAQSQNAELYPADQLMAIEVHYNELDPFFWAWVSYLLAAIVMGASMIATAGQKRWYALAWIFTLLGVAFHSYGFGLRIYLTGRPPVSNMYESVVWVSWGTLLFGMIFEWIYRRKYLLLSANIVGVICLIVASLAPTILDPSLQPLEPVLRSNMWLTIHVLTITLSYSTFFLALLLGDVGLLYFLKDGADKKANDLAQATYRVIQVGVVLLFAGTVLGGIWADYSWGRFWGWDPKETWAFIAFMGYMAILHAKKAGYIRNFGFLVSVVVAFSLVVMAWYGVNYVLGVGLHSYGFGGGGIPFVAAFIAIHLIYIIFAATVYRSKKK